MAKLETVELNVVGDHTIHCGGCANAIQVGLSRLPGVKQVQADHNTQRVEVSADVEQTDLATVREWLEALGYQTEPVS